MHINIRFFLRQFLMFLLFSFHDLSLAGNEDRQFERQRVQLAIRIERLLVEHGHCQSVADCRARSVLSISPGAAGLDVQIYSIKNAMLLKYVFNECLEIYQENTRKMGIKLNAYEISKNDSLALKFWQSGRPLFLGELKENR